MLPIACLLAALSTAPTPPPPADALVLKMLDGEALYTVSGGLKPVSEGFWQTSFPATQDTSEQVEAVRKTLAGLPLGPDLGTGVLVYSSAFEGKRHASAFVAHSPSLKALIERRQDVFEPIGISAESSAQQVMEAIDRAPPAARWRAFGLVFGYPEYAVEFFVSAGEEEKRTGQFVTRDFLNIPTFTGERGRFVYAVPKGHTERTEDVELRAKAEPVLTRYRAWRSVYVDEQKFGAVALLSAWVARAAATPIVCNAIALESQQFNAGGVPDGRGPSSSAWHSCEASEPPSMSCPVVLRPRLRLRHHHESRCTVSHAVRSR